MIEIYANILGSHAADVIKSISGFNTVTSKVVRQTIACCQEYELAVCIDFKGSLADKEKISGYLLCGSVKHLDSQPLLEILINYFGLNNNLADSPQSAVDILSEFLNITIGLTDADWSEHGFEMEFSTPVNVSGQTLQLDKASQAFNIEVLAERNIKVNFIAIFKD